MQKSTPSTSRSEVAVVGAGPAGAAAALSLARRGIAVTLLERAPFPRPKICGEYLSAGAVRVLSELGVASRLAADALPLEGIRLHSGSAFAQLRFSGTAWSLPREQLDAAILGAAVEAGAVLVQGRLEELSFTPDQALLAVRTPEGLTTLRAAMVIGADGIHSLVARKCGLRRPAPACGRYAAGGHYSGLRNLGRFIEMFVDGPRYLAVNPISAKTANVMAVAPQRDFQRQSGAADLIGDMCAEPAAGAIGLHGAILEGERLAVGPLTYRAASFASHNVLLAGDAARLIDPFTGQGVYLALCSARFAAETVIAILRRGADRTRAIRAYEARLTRLLRSRAALAAVSAAAARIPALAPFAGAFAPLLRAVAA